MSFKLLKNISIVIFFLTSIQLAFSNEIIIPKNKPLIVKKERLRKVKKSKYYSDRDLNYAKQAILFMEKSNWKDAKKVANKARAKSIYKISQRYYQ